MPAKSPAFRGSCHLTRSRSPRPDTCETARSGPLAISGGMFAPPKSRSLKVSNRKGLHPGTTANQHFTPHEMAVFSRLIGSQQGHRALTSETSWKSPRGRAFWHRGSADDHLSRAPGCWTEASLLFHVVALDQDTLSAHVEGFNHCGRSGALQPAGSENNINRVQARDGRA